MPQDLDDIKSTLVIQRGPKFYEQLEIYLTHILLHTARVFIYIQR